MYYYYHCLQRCGIAAQKGPGVEKDLIRAAEFYRLSTEQGNSNGQNHFGYCLERGMGVEKDLIRAAEYYRLSEEQRNSDGRYNLGRNFESGQRQ
jgi:TPR repeat protein